MTLSIDKFRAGLDRHGGVARNNKFRIILPQLQGIQADSVDLNLFATNVELPGKDLETIDRKVGVRNATKHAVTYSITDLTITFIETNNGFVKSYIDKWQELAIDPVTGMTYYRRDYEKDITVDHLDPTGKNTFRYILRGCFPKVRSTFSYDNDAKDEILRFPVSFEVKDYTTDFRDT